ncbi:unnamed protein product [Brassica rapa]|uniref:TRF2/HOY1 PH-like domain-containing protein n=1 Tax=Brassica campestris TaxID=3711 RepID=A0A3P5Z292_BRACM|nr:unnamed protein product [Brassica rapa]VDC73229.1 unnamed protein product [Brassica rapa]
MLKLLTSTAYGGHHVNPIKSPLFKTLSQLTGSNRSSLELGCHAFCSSQSDYAANSKAAKSDSDTKSSSGVVSKVPKLDVIKRKRVLEISHSMMNGWGEESQGGPCQITPEMANNFPDEFHGATPIWFGGLEGEDTLVQEGLYPPLNLTYTPTQEHFNKIESKFQEERQKQLYSTENTKALTTHETPTTTEKLKAMNFEISKITIGEWTHKSVYPHDLIAKFYFAKKRLMWEILDEDSKLKRKIEMQWSDVLSFRASFPPQNETGTLEVELGKCPTFFLEVNPQRAKHTQWKQLDQDFTPGQSASKYRRHTLQISPGDLKMNLEKLVSAVSFWSKLAKVNFPTLPQSLYFDNGNSNNNGNSNLCPNGNCTTLGINGNHLYPQGLGHVPVENVNFNMATELCPNNQMNPIFQDDHQDETMSQLPGMQVTHPSSQHINMGRYIISGSHFNNPMIPDDRHTSNTGKLRGPYLQDILAQEEVIQNMKCIRQFQTNGEYCDCDCNQCFNNINGSLPPDS